MIVCDLAQHSIAVLCKSLPLIRRHAVSKNLDLTSRCLAVATVCLLLFGSAQISTCVGEEPFRIRVLSYNIHHGEGVDRVLDLERIAKVITGCSPDVVALQEVDVETQRSRGVDQAAELARLTGYEVVFGKNIDFQGGGYGNAFLSKYPIERHDNQRLPNLDDGEQRGVLVVDIRPSDELPRITFLATHLDHRRDDEERFKSAQQLVAWAAERDAQPSILAGDLNATRDTRVLEKLQEVWTIAGAEEQPTVPVSNPSRQIDFVLHSRGDWKVISSEVLEEAVASDHRAIVVELEWVEK